MEYISSMISMVFLQNKQMGQPIIETQALPSQPKHRSPSWGSGLPFSWRPPVSTARQPSHSGGKTIGHKRFWSPWTPLPERGIAGGAPAPLWMAQGRAAGTEGGWQCRASNRQNKEGCPVCSQRVWRAPVWLVLLLKGATDIGVTIWRLMWLLPEIRNSSFTQPCGQGEIQSVRQLSPGETH
jgi:hypothetical protein